MASEQEGRATVKVATNMRGCHFGFDGKCIRAKFRRVSLTMYMRIRASQTTGQAHEPESLNAVMWAFTEQRQRSA
jgi:hypothetical protein